jgi:hypothetical protein
MVQRRLPPTLPTTQDYESPTESMDDEDSPIPKAPLWTSSPVRHRHVLHHRHVSGGTNHSKQRHDGAHDGPSRGRDGTTVPRHKRKRKHYAFSRWIRTCLLAGIPAYLLLIYIFLKRLNERNAPLGVNDYSSTSNPRHNNKPDGASTLSWRALQHDLLKKIADRPRREMGEIQLQKASQQKREAAILQRRSRTRPPLTDKNNNAASSSSSSSHTSSPPPLVIGRSSETFFEADHDDSVRPGLIRAAKLDELCGRAARTAAAGPASNTYQTRDALQMPKSRIPRVIITGILDRPAFLLALALHQNCGVEVIIGIDSMFPNTIPNRLQLQEPMSILTKHIPKLSKPLLLSYIGTDTKTKNKNSKVLGSTQELDLVATYAPTHIVHFASYDEDDPSLRRRPNRPNGNNGHDDDDPAAMYKLRNGLIGMEQILESIALAPLSDRPHLLYASSSVSWGRRMDELLANYYYQEYGVYSVALRLPNAVYGPWGSPTSTLNRIFSGNFTTPSSLSDLDELDLLHTDDVVSGLIAAMQYRDERPAIVDLEAAATRVSTQQLQDMVQQVLYPEGNSGGGLELDGAFANADSQSGARQSIGWSPQVSVDSGIPRTVAWHLDKRYPFGHGAAETGDMILERHNLGTCVPDDILCHAGRPFLPCASECSIHQQCQPTIFDGLVTIVQDVTEECDYVLYTQNLNEKTKSLDISSEYIEDADPVICNVAFINQNSKLVDAVISKVPDNELGKLGIDAHPSSTLKYDKLNGRLLYRGWILVWTKVPNKLPAYEEFLLKLSPGKLFHKNVKAAVYIDQRFSVSPTYNDILFLVQELHRKAWSSRILKRKSRPKAKFLLPSEPERHAVVLMSELKLQDSSKSKPLDPGVRISAYEATRFMRYSNGEEPLGREPADVKIQREFYDRLRASINPDHGRHPDAPVHKFELKHWAKTSWVVHDLQHEDSRLFRCEWYQEHALWGTKLDQLSFAYVMEKSELERELEHNEPDESVQKHLSEATAVKKMLSDTFEWHALKTEQNKLYISYSEIKMLPYNMDSADDHAMTGFDETLPPQLFVRIISDRVMKLARKAWTSRAHDTHPASVQGEL